MSFAGVNKHNRDFSLTQITSCLRWITSRLAYQSPSLEVFSVTSADLSAVGLIFRRVSSLCVQRIVTIMLPY